MRVLSMFLPACLANSDGSPVQDSEFTILHCNNPTTMKAEMKVEVAQEFLDRNGGLEASWADGFALEEATGIYAKIIEAADLTLEEKEDDTDNFYLGYQIVMAAQTVGGFMTVGIDRNINLSCRFPRVIDTNQEFNVNQDLKGAQHDGEFVYQASVEVSEIGDIRTLKIEPKHGIGGIYARIQQCRIYVEEPNPSGGGLITKEVWPAHSYLNDQLCVDERIGSTMTSDYPNIEIEYRTFRFSGLTAPDQLQKTFCGLTLHKVEDVTTDDSIDNGDGTKILTPPVACTCFDINECQSLMPTEAPTTTTTLEPVETTTGEADKRLEELKGDANRFRGQFDKNSFSIISQRSLDTGSEVILCNGIRVDFEYILTRVECCEENVQLVKGNNTMMIHAINILKDPCSNADPIVLDTCTNSPADCPDNALKNCAENQLGTDGGNCFIQAHLDWDEKAVDMCHGAQQTAGATSTCWTFATTRENQTPCMVPMIETETNGNGDPCADGEICATIAQNFQQTFIDDGYVISIGAAMVCEVQGESFMRGIIRQSIGQHKSLLVTGSQRSSDNGNGNGNSNAATVSISFAWTGPQTTITVENMVSVLHLDPVPAKPLEIYEQHVTGFDNLGSGDPWNSVSSLGATLATSDCYAQEPNATQYGEDVVPGFPYVVNLLMQSESQMQSSEGKHCTGTIINPFWVATSMSCCDGAMWGVLEFDDWRTGNQGTGTTTQSSTNVGNGHRAVGRRRRSIGPFGRKRRSTDGEDTYNEATCIEDGICKKDGICLLRSNTDLLELAEENNIPAKKACLPSQGAIHGKQCWIGGWDNRLGRARHLIEVNAFSCNTDNADCDYANEYCIDHSEYTREMQSDGTTPATTEADTDKLTIADNLMCAGYPAYEVSTHTGAHGKTPATNSGFRLDQGGPLICREPDSPNPDKLVLVGIANRNMLSKDEGKPGVFARVFEAKSWIEEKIQTWSEWTACDHTCKQTRKKSCASTDTTCNHGLVTETQKCPDDQLTTYDNVALSWLADGYKTGCMAETSNLLPESKIKSGQLKTCEVEVTRYRRESDRFSEIVEKTSRIISGVDVKPYSWPWLVRLNFLSKKQYDEPVEEGTMCSGTIFHENYILTAAHCCRYKYIVHVHFNDHSRSVMDKDESTLSILKSKFTLHDQFEYRKGHDVCLIELPEPIHGGKVPCLLPPPGTGSEPATGKLQLDQYHGAQCWVAGWGHTFYNGQASDTARSVGVNLFARDYCIAHTLYPENGDLFTLTDDTFCAGIPHNDKTKTNSQGNHVTQNGADSCKGDSGGPLVCDINGTLTLMGIVSKGRMCNKVGLPGIYTNIQAFRSWLDEKKAYIWSEWGTCNENTCLQRRKRQCVDADKCPALVEAGIDSTHADYIGEGWEKFERKCMDVADCFAGVTEVTAGTDPMAGLNFCDFDHARVRRSADNDTEIVQTSRVVSGTVVDSSVATMPWVVRLEFEKDGTTKQCAGTVVHKSWILTTQDCCQSGNTVQIFYKDYNVGSVDSGEFDKTGPSSDGKSDGTCFIKAHTDLSTNESDGTISSIETKIPCLMDQDTSVNDLQGYRCWSVGWGKTSQDGTGDYSTQLLSAAVSLMKRDYCLQHSLYDGTTLDATQYCAGSKPVDTNTKQTINGVEYALTSAGGAGCDGDNGGPLICDVHGTATLVGIQNGFDANNCGQEGYPTKYLDISNLELLTQLKCRDKDCLNNSGCYLNKSNEATCLCTPAWKGDRCQTKAEKSTSFLLN